MTRSSLSGLPGIGKKYIDLWVELKALYKENHNIQPLIKPLVENDPDHEVDFDGMTINFSALSAIEKKNLEKLYRLKESDDILEVINFKSLEFEKTEGIGEKFISAISGLKERLQVEIEKISKGIIDYKNMESELILSTKFRIFPVEQVGTILLEDIDNFLDGIDEKEQEIFQYRWGFVESELTLEEVGVKHLVTRERIRQKEAKINSKLIRSMRLTQENIWLNLKDNINLKLPQAMENLSSCFDKEKNFYRFLGYICDDKNISNIVRPDIRTDILNPFFAEHGEPCSIYQAKEYIQANSFLSDSNADNVLDYLSELRKIEIKDENVYPKYLKKNEAAACVLCKHPQGLPWLDVANIVNSRAISRTKLNQDRPDNQALFDSDFVYLAGKGVYKHTKYMNLSEINIDSVFESLLVFFDETNRDVFHLNEVCRKSVFLQDKDYYAIRYIVKMYGEDYGFYFDGKSQADSVGLEKGFKNITQKDVILQAMSSNKKPMTKPEIAALLKSNSIGHAAYYLDEMIGDEQIVQVDRMLYTTPEIAYKDIDLPRYIAGINEILLNENRPVDPSIFQHKLNIDFNKAYSKYFYSSIAKNNYQKNNWHRKQNLYSLYDIKYNNLTDAINKHCKSDFDTNTNFKRLSEFIAITRESAQVSIGNWQNTLKNC
ncbi:MAG: sigma factor-like helix-turn-helix DNA-binding protein [Gammaproteobacteria bacterium]|nr:sigma factor-like helix-turn-helix DNA-binding protein [Gammaproteobacteria bacterium]